MLHPFFNTLLDLDPDARLAAVAAHYEELVAAITQGGGGSEEVGMHQSEAKRNKDCWHSCVLDTMSSMAYCSCTMSAAASKLVSACMSAGSGFCWWVTATDQHNQGPTLM